MRPSVCPSIWLPITNYAQNSPTILSESFLKLCRCFCQGLKMCMTFGCNPHIILYHFFRSLRSFFGSSYTNAYIHWVSCERSSSYNQPTVMCTNRCERRLISVQCQKECMENKLGRQTYSHINYSTHLRAVPNYIFFPEKKKSKTCVPTLPIFFLFIWPNTYFLPKQHFSGIQCKTFRPVLVIVFIQIIVLWQSNVNTQNQWQYSCHKIWYKNATTVAPV